MPAGSREVRYSMPNGRTVARVGIWVLVILVLILWLFG
jgi:hypothetical protein